MNNLKKKYPDLNWEEANDVHPEDLEAAADMFDRLVKEKRDGIKK